MGPQGIIGTDNGTWLVKHIKELEDAGFPPDHNTKEIIF